MTQSPPSRPLSAGLPGPTFQLPPAPGRADRTGCPWHDVKEKLREVGLRPTRQRMALGWILFAKGDRHVTAEMLYEEATRAKVPVSLATVYNTLHQFTEVGLLRQVAVDGSKAYFDTNNSEHHHFFIEDQNDLMDIPSNEVLVGKAPVAPEGYEIARIDVVVRLRRGSRADPGNRDESLDLLVRINAPQLVLLDPAVKTVAGDLAPFAGAVFDRAQHADLQLRRHRALGVGLGIDRRQVGLRFQLHGRRCACPTAASDRPSPRCRRNRGCGASSRTRR